MSEAYRKAGVDIERGDEVVERIKGATERTRRPEVMGGLGGFGALVGLPARYKDPVLVSGTDGVGTKLLVAQRLGRHRTIGIDLVAMCVNDILTVGAEPLFFLDYFAVGKLDPLVAAEVVEGIADGCVQAGCALVGGETAEMPGMYAPGHYDLAGFAVGVVERAEILDGRGIVEGMALVGVPSSGVHSNGYSLVRKLVDDLDWAAVHEGFTRPLGDELLEPTRIYKDAVLTLRGHGARGFAHITGGGLVGNVGRMFPPGLGGRIERGSWPMPRIFSLLRERGGLTDADMDATFNQGLGLVAAVPQERAQEASRAVGGFVVGSVVEDAQGLVELV